ncbi:hypothetical protein [Corallococcus sp. M7]
MHGSSLPARCFAATVPTFAILAALTMLAPASVLAQGLPFSPDCRTHQQVPVNPPSDALLLTKQPVPHPNGTATVHDLINLINYVIPAGANSCVVAAPPADGDYCFSARNDNTILSVGIAAIRNPGGLTACQVAADAPPKQSPPRSGVSPVSPAPGSPPPAPEGPAKGKLPEGK